MQKTHCCGSATSASSLGCLQIASKTLQIGLFKRLVDLTPKAAGEDLTKRGGASEWIHSQLLLRPRSACARQG